MTTRIRVACSACKRARLLQNLTAGLLCKRCASVREADCFGGFLHAAECRLCFDKSDCIQETKNDRASKLP